MRISVKYLAEERSSEDFCRNQCLRHPLSPQRVKRSFLGCMIHLIEHRRCQPRQNRALLYLVYACSQLLLFNITLKLIDIYRPLSYNDEGLVVPVVPEQTPRSPGSRNKPLQRCVRGQCTSELEAWRGGFDSHVVPAAFVGCSR
jgi:hypothetical protein